MVGQILQSGQQSRGFARGKPGFVVKADRIPKRNATVVFEQIPVNIKKVQVGIRRAVPGNPGTRNEFHGPNNLVLPAPKLGRSLRDRDLFPIENKRY
jgi:hypothetical protein